MKALDPRTLRWVSARFRRSARTRKLAPVLAGQDAAFADEFLELARTIEKRRTKNAGKRG